MQKAMHLHKMKRGKSGVRLSRSLGGTIAIALFLLVIGAFMALPIVYSLIQSVKPLDEIFAYPPRFFVRHPTFDNYIQVYQLCQNLWVPLSRYVFNSLFIAGVGTFVYVILASMAAFPLSKHKFLGKAVISALIVWALLFRSEVTGISQYIIISGMGMINTYWALLLPPLASTFGVFLMMQFMESAIPDAVLEAARIDGAGEFRIFARIMVPNAASAFLVEVIMCIVWNWNDYFFPAILFQQNQFLSTKLSIMRQLATSMMTTTQYGDGLAETVIMYAGAFWFVLPMLVLYMFAQRFFLQSVERSGITG